MSTTKISTKIATTQHRRIQELIRLLKARKVTYSRSDAVRESLNYDVCLLGKAPYMATDTTVSLLVTRRGQFVYHQSERLRLNSELRAMRFDIKMKHDKIIEFLPASSSPTAVRAQWRDVWFRVLSPDGQTVLAEGTDAEGITTKQASLNIPMEANQEVIREQWVVLDDYALWSTAEDPPLAKDAVEFDVKIPSLATSLAVLLDSRLFPTFAPKPVYRLQTCLGASLSESGLLETGQALRGHKLSGAFQRGGTDEIGREAAAVLAKFEQLAELRGHRDEIAWPERGSFFRVSLPRCRMGLRMRVEWPRPRRPRAGGSGR